ncbi:hypothetical protein FRX31_021185 [Thalictrum thalictroides]|uniref:Histone h1 n=1 Tax=Thalictrum thalictroides TaxID=46969 RepID=A0A7J6VX11_THATH|nr:hypothetical protein FRX31_021185 [Thalictrum thalictroides]
MKKNCLNFCSIHHNVSYNTQLSKTAIEKKPKAAAKPTPAADVSAKTKAVKKPATKKKAATTVKPVKKAGVKKSMKSNPVKKSTPVKLKQLKSIKSPAAKKSKKA